MTGPVSLSTKWDDYVRTPFPVLVRISMNRIFYGSKAGDEELNVSMGLLLALLALPGGFASVVLFDKYGSFLQWLRGQSKFDPLTAAMPDEYFFIVLSMVVTGGIALWWWDSIFPDRRDFVNLAPLPITTSRIFLANAAAILLLTSLCVIDVNAASSILFPASVGGAQPHFGFVIKFAVVHTLVVMLASIFGFLAVFATSGFLMLLLPYSLFRRISLYARGLIAMMSFTALATSFTIPSMILELPSSYSVLRFLPPAWFLGLCQSLRGRADRSLAELGHIALFALGGAAVMASISYAISYHRRFVRLLELADAPPGYLGTRSSRIFSLQDKFILRTPFQRAGYRFVLKTLFRNEAHSLAAGGLFALGVVVASRTLFLALNGKGVSRIPSADVLSIPFILSFCLAVGVRFAFDIPAHLQANWIFRFLVDRSVEQAAPLARRVILCFGAPTIMLVALPIYLHFWGWRVALVHVGVVATWLILLTEVLLVGFRKLPFTCTYPQFQHSTVVIAMAYVFAYFAYTTVTAELESTALSRSLMGTILLVGSLGVWYVVYRVRKSFIEVSEHIVFEDVSFAPFQCLDIEREI